MTTHAPTVAFSGIDCLDSDVQVQVANGLPAFTNVDPITLDRPARQ
ncbi:MAG: ATPase [Magnetospirillum sp.]|nr:ATPase [Magnetospirillum sp.]